jgi:hypothetical protein
MCRGVQTFPDHAAVLASLLTQYASLSRKCKVSLSQYIVTKSFLKILWQINNQKYSKHFMDALHDVPTIPYHPTHVWTQLSPLDHAILNLISTIAAQCGIAIPKLEAMAKNHQDSAQLYTMETCQEFHLLLCVLL